MNIYATIHSEGYCCLAGYLRLCRARGETVPAMAANFGISPHNLWHHYRRLEKEKLKCQNFSDCLQPIIDEILLERCGKQCRQPPEDKG